MRNLLLAAFISVSLFACTKSKESKTLSPRPLGKGEFFDESTGSKTAILSILKTDSGKTADADRFAIAFKDTVLSVENAQKIANSKFIKARYINSQKTAILAQVDDQMGTLSPLYIFNLKNGSVEAVNINRISNGKNDRKFTKGIEDLTVTYLLVNNDYVINVVNGKVYTLTRENDAERIQGKFFMYSSDKTTLLFVTDKAFYQTNYRTGESSVLAVPAKVLQATDLNSEIQSNYVWSKNAKGTEFLKKGADDDRIVDISEFKQ